MGQIIPSALVCQKKKAYVCFFFLLSFHVAGRISASTRMNHVIQWVSSRLSADGRVECGVNVTVCGTVFNMCTCGWLEFLSVL